jgi:hypothetical protein
MLVLLLKVLFDLGVFASDPNGYRLTPLGDCLRTGQAGTWRDWTVVMGEEVYRAWGELLYPVQTGEPGFDRVYGKGFFEHYDQNPSVGTFFHALLATDAAQHAAAVLAAYDFSGTHRVIDIGGGTGGLLAAILKVHAAMQGVLSELPSLQEGAQRLFEAQGVADRASFVGGSFFEAVPSGGDVYLIMRCIRNWDDERARQILSNCRRSIADHGRLLVIEPVVTPGSSSAMQLLGQRLITRAHDRTEVEHRELLWTAGFALERVIPLSDLSILEATAS